MTLDEYIKQAPHGESARLARVLGCTKSTIAAWRHGRQLPRACRVASIVRETGGLVTPEEIVTFEQKHLMKIDRSDFEVIVRSIFTRLGYSIEDFCSKQGRHARLVSRSFHLSRKDASRMPGSMQWIYTSLSKSGATPEEQRAMLIAYLKLSGDLFFVEKMAPTAMRDIYAFISRRLETERGVFVQHEPDERFKSKYMRSK